VEIPKETKTGLLKQKIFFKYHNFDISGIYYDSWNIEENVLVDLTNESKKLSSLVQNSENFMIIAKSAGSAISIKAVVDSNINPAFCLFYRDPYYSFKEAEEFLNPFTNIQVISAEGSSHDYNKFEDYLKLLTENL